jgi:FkbH-like protein
LFDTQKLTASDKNRTASYQALNRAKEDMENAGNLEDFLSSLEMKSFVTQAGPEHLDRMVQMELRTNQFNVTTRRYRSDQIEEILRQANAYWLVFKLIDRYADHGVVSTLLAFQEEDTLRIDSWLMSCRVFSRTLEQYSLNRLLGIAQSTGVRKIIGEYVETERNMPVENLYPKLGFQPQGSDKRWWEFEISESMKPLETFVQK